MDYVLMTVVNERDQTLSGPLPTATPPALGDVVHGYGRIISIQNHPGTPTRVTVKVHTGPYAYYTVYQLALVSYEGNTLAFLNVPLCCN